MELGASFSGNNLEFLGESGGGGLWVDGEMSGFRGGCLSPTKDLRAIKFMLMGVSRLAESS